MKYRERRKNLVEGYRFKCCQSFEMLSIVWGTEEIQRSLINLDPFCSSLIVVRCACVRTTACIINLKVTVFPAWSALLCCHLNMSASVVRRKMLSWVEAMIVCSKCVGDKFQVVYKCTIRVWSSNDGTKKCKSVQKVRCVMSPPSDLWLSDDPSMWYDATKK